jgi:hypothetical protein
MMTDEEALERAARALDLAGHLAMEQRNSEQMLNVAAGWVAIYDRMEYGEADDKPFGFGMDCDDDDEG